MHVQRVAMPGSRVESWTVLGDDDVPVEPVERYLAYLTAVGRSPNTVKAYAHDLKDYWVFLRGRGLDWRQVRLEDLGEYVAWLRLPVPGRAGPGRWRRCRRRGRPWRPRRSAGSCRRWPRSISIRSATVPMSAGS
jgi:Phage integrase, N-terminal SAM-like domain